MRTSAVWRHCGGKAFVEDGSRHEICEKPDFKLSTVLVPNFGSFCSKSKIAAVWGLYRRSVFASRSTVRLEGGTV